MTIGELKKFAAQIRLETVNCIGSRGFGHIGGDLSVAEALAVLYGGVMRIDPKHPYWPDRDKLVMSKGHAGPALYGGPCVKPRPVLPSRIIFVHGQSNAGQPFAGKRAGTDDGNAIRNNNAWQSVFGKRAVIDNGNAIRNSNAG